MLSEFREHQIEKGEDYTEKFISVSSQFFSLWQERADLFHLIKTVKAESLLIEKLREHHRKVYELRVAPIHPISDPEIEAYFITHITYNFYGILEQWIMDGMKRTPQEMGELHSYLRTPSMVSGLAERYG